MFRYRYKLVLLFPEPLRKRTFLPMKLGQDGAHPIGGRQIHQIITA